MIDSAGVEPASGRGFGTLVRFVAAKTAAEHLPPGNLGMESRRMTFLENSTLYCAAPDFVHSHRRACRVRMSMKPNRIPTFLLVSLDTFLVAATSKAWPWVRAIESGKIVYVEVTPDE